MISVVRSLAALAVLAGWLSTGPAWAHVQEIRSGMNGLCLDVPGARFTQGALLQMYSCNGSRAQHFELTPAGEIRVAGLCVDAYGGQGHNGDQVGLWQCHGGPNQRWSPRRGRLMGMNGRCLEILNHDRREGAKLVLSDCDRGDNQTWVGLGEQEHSDRDRRDVGPSGDHPRRHDQAHPQEIRSGLNGLCLDVPGARFEQGALLQMYSCNGTQAQHFDLTPAGEIRVAGLCVDAFGGQGRNGDRVGLWQCHGGPNQRWASRQGRLVGMNGRCLDIQNQNRREGASLILWDCHGGANQSWVGVREHASFDHDRRDDRWSEHRLHEHRYPDHAVYGRDR